jgi:hypothetical protein
MASNVAWREDDREFLKSVADRRDWIASAVKRFPHRSEAAIRCMMQKVRIELGTTEGRFMENAWMADAVNGTRALLTAQLLVGSFPE